MKNANILLLYTDRYYLINPVYPFGLDLIARQLRQYGHHVAVESPFLPASHLETNLLNLLENIRPDIIGLGMRNLDTCLACEPYGDYAGHDFRTFYFLPDVKRIVDVIKGHSPSIPMVAGGGAFSISPEAILNFLAIEHGVIGEGEEPLREFIEAFPDTQKMRNIPGLAYMHEGFHMNPRKAYVFGEKGVSEMREDTFHYAFETTGFPVEVKRGCNQKCSYCVEPIIEGNVIAFRDVEQIIQEIRALSQSSENIRQIFFVDTEFNIPDLSYGTRLVAGLIKSGLHERFAFTSQFLPKPFDSDFAGLLAEAGFSIILTCDSFSDEVLKQNGTSYREKDIENTLAICEEKAIPCTLSMIFGLPGETYETVDYTIEQMKRFPPCPLRRCEYTVGGRIYQGTRLCRMIEKEGDWAHVYGEVSEGYLDPCFFCSPKSPLQLKHYIEEGLGYSIAYDNRYDPSVFGSLAIAYMADKSRWEKAVAGFMQSRLSVRSRIYDYLFRRLTEAGRTADAKRVSQDLLHAITEDKSGAYLEQAPMVQFYLNCLDH